MGLRFLALACLVGAAFAGPVQRQSKNLCATKCNPPSNPQFRLESGNAYVYNYVSQNNITSAGTQKQEATIRATVEFHVLSQCEGILRIKNTRIDQEVSQEEKDHLKEKMEIPLRYSYTNGKFEHVCPSHEESTQSLNIKKGILSSLVNEMSSFKESQEVQEEDSLGKCLTKYAVENKNGMKKITKVKNLKTCTNRHTIQTSFLKKNIPSSLLFEDDYLECNQYITNGLATKVRCNEGEKLKTPFKGRNSLVKFSGMIELTFVEITSVEKLSWGEPLNQEEIKYSIDEPRQGDRNVKEVERILQTICSRNTLFVDMAIGKDYIKLVSLVRHLPYEDLYNIYKSLDDGTLCSSKKVRGIFVDTLPVVATDASIKLMVKLIETKAVTGLKSKLWPVTLALKQKPTVDTVAAIVPLAKIDQSSSTLIAVSTLINRFCSFENCDDISPVGEIVEVFNNYLGSRCSSDDEKQILRALRVFGNMGYLGKAQKNIAACAKDRSKSTRLRLAAVDTFRRLNETRPQEFIQIYSDKNENHELRIACFESVMKHADERQLRQMKSIAEGETNAQVSGFVYTYIQNMNRTSFPTHQNVKGLLQNNEIHPPKVDYLTNSKHIEFSAFNKPLSVGGSFEAAIVQGVETKLPLSMRTRFDAEVFGHNFNLMQFGVRTEGLEDVVQKLIALKDKLPKMQKIRDRLAQKPSLEELKEEFNYLSPEKVFGDIRPEVSMFFRALETELIDVSTNDLSGVTELLKIAELMTKLAHGKEADFSHSFVIMNSKLVVPSVTGRSYTIDLSGSSTVGLTAKTKADLLKLPRNADVHLHLQPSVNLEISTTVGLQSNTHRPGMKHVSRLHLESDVEARFEVRDGHVALASFTLPSENVALAKISTDVFVIDRNHNEVPYFEKRQKKIDSCFQQLSKPLGIAACATIEVPKPFITNSFPYVFLVGSGEISLKKTDKSFKSYQIRFEIPKQKGPSMKYRASFDTPGSRISRRFSADLELKQQRDQTHAILELVSPFKTFGTSVSFTKNDQLMQGIMELHSSKTQIASANITSKIVTSRSRKIYEIVGEYSILNQEPGRLDGSVSIIKGRKHQLNFDIRTNKPQSKPIALKGSIMMEGLLGAVQKSEWKISSEVSLQSPVGDIKLRQTLDKRSKQSEAISANIGIDYQLEGKQKQSLTISGTSQKSSNKVSTHAKFESTQNPRVNMYLTWDMQRESPESLKNDIKLKYGQNPERTYIQVKQNSRIPKTGPGHCSATIDIPHRNVHYELSLTHDMDMSEQPRINIEADLCYNQDKHIKSVLDVKYESKSPLKASGRLELEYPGGHYIYEDEIVETSDNVLEGKSKLQYKKDKIIQFNYKYSKLSHGAKLHHEIESSIITPSSRSPINGKASIELDSKSLDILGHFGHDYYIQAHLKEDGVSQINLKLPIMEGTIKSTEEEKRKTLDVDLTVKTRKPRHVTGSVIAELGDKKKFELKVYPDVDVAPEKKIFISTVVKMTSRDSKDFYTSASRLQVLDLIDVSLAESGDVSLLGDQECTLEVSVKNQKPVSLRLVRKTSEEQGKTTFVVSQSNVEKARLELEAKLKETSNKREFSIETSLISSDNSFEDVYLSLKNQITRSGSTQAVQTTLFFKKNNKVYKTELNSDIQPNGLEVNAQLQTPHVNYKKNAIGLSLQMSDSGISSLVNIACSDNEKFAIQTEIKTKNHGLSFTCKLNTPFEIAKDAQLQVTLEDHRTRKSLQASLDTNNVRVAEIQGRMKKSSEENEIEGNIKISNLPQVKFQGLDVKLQRSRSSLLVSGSLQLLNNKEISLTSEIKKEGDIISTTTSLSTPYENLKDVKAHLSIENKPSKRSILCYLDANRERIGDVELSIASSSQDIELKGRLKTVRTPEISAHVKCEKNSQSFSLSANVMKGTSPLLSTSISKLSYRGGKKLLMKTQSFEDTLLDIEISLDVSGKNSNKYSLNVKKPFGPLSVTFLKNYNEKNSVSAELRACKEFTCYNLKSYHKQLVNSENYRFYQKVTMDLEKTVRGTFSKALGKLHVLASATENDYRSKITMEVNEKKLGYELKLHSRQHENDPCSLDSYIYLPQNTCRVRASMLHNQHRVHFEADAIPNTEDPSRKLSFEMKKEINPDNHEVSGYIKMSHPRMSQPLLFTCKLQPVGDHFVKAKIVLHTGPVWGKTLMIEVIPNIQQEAYGIRSMEIKMHTDDKSIDAYLKLIRQFSRSEKKIGYEWKYLSQDVEKKGGLALTVSNKRGQPKTIIMSYYSPSANYEMQGISQGPEDINLSISSGGRRLKEIRITTSDSCTNIEVTKSGSLIKGQVCVNKRVGSELQLLKVDVQYRQHKCIDIRVGVDPETPEYLDIVFKCSKEESCRVLKEIFNPSHLFNTVAIRKFKQDVLVKVRHVQQVVEDRVVQIRSHLQSLKDDVLSKVKIQIDQRLRIVKEYIRKMQETKENILNHVKSIIPDYVKETIQKYFEEYRKVAIRFHRKISERVTKYWAEVCGRGWRCNDIKSAFRRFDAKNVKMLTVRKINEIRQSLKFRLPRFRFIYPSEIIQFVRDTIVQVRAYITTTFGKFVETTLVNEIRKYGSKLEMFVRQKVIDTLDQIIKKIHEVISVDEDLQTAQGLILNAKDKVIKAWKNKEEIAETSARKIESDIKETLKHLVDKQIQVLKYDPKGGDLRFRVRQPFSKSKIEVLKKEFNLFFHTLREYLNL